MHSVYHLIVFFFFNDTATTEIYTLSLHDALPIYRYNHGHYNRHYHLRSREGHPLPQPNGDDHGRRVRKSDPRSEEHTSELQSRQYLVCRLLLEKKNKKQSP